MPSFPATIGVILAGGLARRMGGGDKSLLDLGGKTLLAHVAQRLAPQCNDLILNANGDPSRFGDIDFPVVPDSLPGHLGPLAGILAAMAWTAFHHPSAEWIVSVPGDTPFIPEDLVIRLHEACAASRQLIACASSGSRDHFTIGLWPVHLRHDLQHALLHRGLRRMEDWMKDHGLARASWPNEPSDPFLNINTPEDLSRAKALVEQSSNRL